ncbi:MAG: endonuclease/exonuclease/phosphatase family protein [Flavobacteriales bacterium]|nr:endonuclease/exonuclease/phosphatase family protein [Flavobacteriales bacterium]
MRTLILGVLSIVLSTNIHSQSRVFVRNSTWQDFDVEAGQYGTFSMNSSEWSGGDPIVRGWLESTGQEVLSVNRTNAAVPEGDTAYFDIGLSGDSDYLTIKLRVIGVSGGTELDYSISGNGFSEPWYDDGSFHEVQTTLAGKSVVIKFKPDNDDSNQDRDLRFAIHDLPVYELPEEDFQNPNVLNAMFYNIQMISFGVSGMPQAADRGDLLPAQISEYQDVVCFAEAFDDGPREDHLIPAMEAAGFPYRTEILNEPSGLIPFPVNGGVIIFSRWPIEAEDEIDYAECGQAASDCLANKGVKYARINKLGKVYHVFGTHMDAGGNSDDIYARRTQMAEIRDFIADLNIPENEPVLFGGDFNTDPIGGDMDYQAFIDTMHPIIPKHIGFWESSFSDDFGKIIDHAWGDRTHLVPTEITNEIITIRSLDPVLWDISEFSDHRCVLGRYTYPDFSKSGGDTLICPGESISMVVETEFSVTYQWYKDGIEIQGATDSVYHIIDAMESESGSYSCLVSYDVVYGNWTDSITPLFFPNGPDTVEARLNFNFGEVVIDQALCELGIDAATELAYKIYPNPTKGMLNILLEDGIGTAQVNVYSVDGELVRSQRFQGSRCSMDLSDVGSAMLIIEVITSSKTIHQRVVVY